MISPPLDAPMENVPDAPVDQTLWWPSSWGQALNFALNTGKLRVVQTLLAEHVKDPSIGDVNAHQESIEWIHGSPLFVAVHHRSEEAVGMLLKHPGLEVKTLSDRTRPRLWNAALRNKKIVTMLLDAEVDHRPLPRSNGELWSLPRAAVSVRGSLLHGRFAETILNKLNRRNVMPKAADDLAQLLLVAVKTIGSDLDVGPIRWLLHHGAPLTAVNEKGQSLADFWEKLRTKAPCTFVLLEQALLQQQTLPIDPLTTPIKRARL